MSRREQPLPAPRLDWLHNSESMRPLKPNLKITACMSRLTSRSSVNQQNVRQRIHFGLSPWPLSSPSALETIVATNVLGTQILPALSQDGASDLIAVSIILCPRRYRSPRVELPIR